MNITYRVKRSRKRRKTISLQIRNEAEVIISAPYFTPVTEIDRFVEEKQTWINKVIQKQEKELAQCKSKEYETGEHFLYLGKSYPLEVFSEPFENAGVVFWNNVLYLNTQGDKDLRKHYFISWYKKKAHDFVCQRVDFFSRMLKLRYESIKITSAESRWGSCSEDNNLTFSFRLIMAPTEVIDYVIVHELMHIREKNHSSKFWRRVGEVIPEYRVHRRWLKDNHYKFIL
jgi:predicted metal-dependent hydrolase